MNPAVDIDETDMHYIGLILSGHLSSYAIWKATKNTKYEMAYNNTNKRIRKLAERGIICRKEPSSYSEHGSVSIYFDKKKTLKLLNGRIEYYKQLISRIEEVVKGV